MTKLMSCTTVNNNKQESQLQFDALTKEGCSKNSVSNKEYECKFSFSRCQIKRIVVSLEEDGYIERSLDIIPYSSSFITNMSIILKHDQLSDFSINAENKYGVFIPHKWFSSIVSEKGQPNL